MRTRLANLRGVLGRYRARLARHRRRVTVIAAIAAIAVGVVLAHSAVAMDHMGDAMAVCLAIADTAGLGAVALGVVGARRPRRWFAVLAAHARSHDGIPARFGSPSPRGSPFALQVLRL